MKSLLRSIGNLPKLPAPVDRAISLDEFEVLKQSVFRVLNVINLAFAISIIVSGLLYSKPITLAGMIPSIAFLTLSFSLTLIQNLIKFQYSLLLYSLIYPWLIYLLIGSGDAVDTGYFILINILVSVLMIEKILHLFLSVFLSLTLFALIILSPGILKPTPLIFLPVCNAAINILFLLWCARLTRNMAIIYRYHLGKKNSELQDTRSEILVQQLNLKTQYPPENKKTGIHTAGSPKPSVIELSSFMTKVINDMREEVSARKIKLQKNISGSLFVYADKEMVNLITRSLLSNAIKSTRSNGIVTIAAFESSEFAEICIWNDSSEFLNDIKDGRNIGLKLCRDFLSRNGGKLFIEMGEGEVSQFSFTLPLPLSVNA